MSIILIRFNGRNAYYVPAHAPSNLGGGKICVFNRKRYTKIILSNFVEICYYLFEELNVRLRPKGRIS